MQHIGANILNLLNVNKSHSDTSISVFKMPRRKLISQGDDKLFVASFNNIITLCIV